MALAFDWIRDPGAILPRWLVAQVLRMAAGQVGDPMVFLVLVEAQQHRSPSVRAAVAFGPGDG